MITRNDKLKIFEDFQIDRSLPKHRRKKRRDQDSERKEQDSPSFEESEDNVSFLVATQSGVIFEGNQFGETKAKEEKVPAAKRHQYPWPLSWLYAFFSLFHPKPPKPKQLPPPQVEEISIEEFFASVKNSTEELQIVQERAKGYELAIDNAQRAGQTALLEKLREGLWVHRGESQLFTMGKKQYVTEETVVKFVKQAKKGLRLDWVANFTRPVPPELIADKLRADELHVFDNYVILHYDPDAKSWSETKAEKAKRLDPIFFGVMKGCRNLYYMGDWIDEQCDLTLAQIADALGKEVVQEIS